MTIQSAAAWLKHRPGDLDALRTFRSLCASGALAEPEEAVSFLLLWQAAGCAIGRLVQTAPACGMPSPEGLAKAHRQIARMADDLARAMALPARTQIKALNRIAQTRMAAEAPARPLLPSDGSHPDAPGAEPRIPS